MDMVHLLGLGGPFHVVGARSHVEQLEDDLFQMIPELDLLERVVEPTGGDAKVGVVRRDVVHAMMNAWQNDVHVLQDGYVARQAEVRVRPFVKLETNKTNRN